MLGTRNLNQSQVQCHERVFALNLISAVVAYLSQKQIRSSDKMYSRTINVVLAYRFIYLRNKVIRYHHVDKQMGTLLVNV